MSLLLAHGHPDARDYPVAMVWEEAQLIVERVNGNLASEGTILQAAASVAVAAFGTEGKKAHREFVKLMERLSGQSDSPESGKINLTEKIVKERGRNGR